MIISSSLCGLFSHARFQAHEVPAVFFVPDNELALLSVHRFCQADIAQVFGLSSSESQGV